MIPKLFSHWLRYLYIGSPIATSLGSKHHEVDKNIKKVCLKRKHLRNIRKESRRINRPK